VSNLYVTAVNSTRMKKVVFHPCRPLCLFRKCSYRALIGIINILNLTELFVKDLMLQQNALFYDDICTGGLYKRLIAAYIFPQICTVLIFRVFFRLSLIKRFSIQIHKCINHSICQN